MIAEVPVEEPPPPPPPPPPLLLLLLGAVLLWLPLEVPLPLLLATGASTSMDSSLSSPLCSERSLQST